MLCRILGGRRGWPEGLDLLVDACRARGAVLLALGGEAEPDAEMTALSTAPAGAVAQAGEYLRHGDVDNVEQLLRFLADTFLLEGHGFEPPRAVADLGVYVPGRGDVTIEAALAGLDPARPTVGVCFYRSHRLTGNTAFVDGLAAAIEAAGANVLPVWSYTLRRDADGKVPALALLDGHVDALITTMLATGGSGAADTTVAKREGVGESWQEWDARALAALDVPVIQAVCSTSSRATWSESDSGLTPLDAATQVAIPEFDGRLLGGVISFKEREAEGSPVGVPVPRYVPDPERCARVAGLAVAHARLRHTPAAERRVAVLLTAFPTKHAKIGMAVGLDTPASAIALLDTLRADGMRIEHDFADGDALIHALVAAGGHDPEFLTGEQLAAAPLRLPVADYLAWYATLPEDLRLSMEERWGPPPGDRYVDGDDFVIAGLELGNVVVAIQPPRGYGEDPVGIYHDPEAAADPPLPGLLPLDRGGVGRRRDRAPRQARNPRVDAGQDARAERVVRAGRRPRLAPADLPVRRQRPRRGRPGQAPRARDDRRPPRPADDAGRQLRRDRRARGAARRVRAPRGARSVEAPRPRRRASGRRSRRPTCRPTWTSTSGRTTSARSSSTSTATCARSRTSRSRTGCTSSGGPPRASSCAASCRR